MTKNAASVTPAPVDFRVKGCESRPEVEEIGTLSVPIERENVMRLRMTQEVATATFEGQKFQITTGWPAAGLYLGIRRPGKPEYTLHFDAEAIIRAIVEHERNS